MLSRLMRFFRPALVAAALMLPAAAPQAATLVLSSAGTLTGATGVLVNGLAYDVTFEKGYCTDVFAPCDLSTTFFFTTMADATAAAQALLDQVFIDGLLGNFDSDPSLTLGCEGLFACYVMVPYQTDFFDVADNLTALYAMHAGNEPDPDPVPDSVDQLYIDSGDQSVVYAVFSIPPFVPDPSGDGGLPPVPLPAAGWLMLLGFGALAAVRRRSA